MARGMFITLEGGDGAGKSTQLDYLAGHLRAAGIDPLTTREPGGCPGADEIRELLVTGDVARWDPMTEALLHYAARREHVVRVIRPALDSGRWVIADRFADSTMAYQGYGHGLGRETIEALYRATVGDFAPDLTLILDVPINVGLKRTDDRVHAENRYERMDIAFHQRLRDGYLDIAQREPDRCVVIDAMRNREDVQDSIRAIVHDRFGLKV